MVQPHARAEIYQLHNLEEQDVTRPFGGVCACAANSSIATLHELLQIAFDWSDFHLHCAPTSSNWNLTLSNLVAIGPPAMINLASDKSVV
jgi:hypothetical protein